MSGSAAGGHVAAPLNRILGIEHISVFGLHPVDFVRLARRLGCDRVGLGLEPAGDNPHGYPHWSLRTDAGLRRDVVAALADHGVCVSIGDGLLGRPDVPAAAIQADLDCFAELGATTANLVPLDPDPVRSRDSLAAFARAAQDRGLQAAIEFLPGLPLGTLSAAVDMVREVGAPNLGVVLDAMHLFRSGSGVADRAGLARHAIGHL